MKATSLQIAAAEHQVEMVCATEHATFEDFKRAMVDAVAAGLGVEVER